MVSLIREAVDGTWCPLLPCRQADQAGWDRAVSTGAESEPEWRGGWEAREEGGLHGAWGKEDKGWAAAGPGREEEARKEADGKAKGGGTLVAGARHDAAGWLCLLGIHVLHRSFAAPGAPSRSPAGQRPVPSAPAEEGVGWDSTWRQFFICSTSSRWPRKAAADMAPPAATGASAK